MEKEIKLKQRLNVTINLDVYLSAKKAGINLSEFINNALATRLELDKLKNRDKVKLIDEITNLKKEREKITSNIIEKEIILKTVEDKERKVEQEELKKAERVLKGLKANNPLRDL